MTIFTFDSANQTQLVILLFGVSLFVCLRRFMQIRPDGVTPKFFVACLFEFSGRLLPCILTILTLRKIGIFAELYYLLWFVVGLVVSTMIVETVVNSVPLFSQLRLQIRQPRNRTKNFQSTQQNIET